MTTEFAHLHTHSEHSILDGFSKTVDVPRVAAELGQSAIALTDHGSLGGALKFWKASREHERKGIFGVETYVTPDIRIKEKDSPTWHLVLLAQNRTGLNNLFAMSKIGWTDGFYKKPRVDYNTLASHSDGIIALSACMGGEAARAIEQNDMVLANEVLDRYKSIYGDRFYVELQPGNQRDLNVALAELGSALNIKTTVTVDAHYDHEENASITELLLIMQQVSGFKQSDKEFARFNYEAANRQTNLGARLNELWPNRFLRFDKHHLHLMSRHEVEDHMDDQGFSGKELCDTTLEIAERCEQIDFKLGVNYLPKVVKEDQSSSGILRSKVRAGLAARGLDKDPVYLARAKEELDILCEKGFADYFLIVEDIISEARKRNIYVGTGRGSAAGSLVAYALRITGRDPIKDKLLFFRFISVDRSDFPDIDMDFEHRRRDEMKDYVRDKYGEVLSLSTYTELGAKSLIRKMATTLCIPLSEVDGVSKLYESLDEYENSQAEKLVQFRVKHPELLPLAKKLESHISAAGMHAAAVVVADRPMSEIVPMETRADPQDKKNRVLVSAFDMHDASDVGLIKFDFLGLNALTVIHDCIDLIKERHGIEVDWEALETDDPNVLADLNKGNTVGVFQMESSPYRKLLKAMGVDTFEDLVASNALVRPGAFLTVAKDYIDRKKGRKQVKYPHADVEQELKDTYGTYIYQEQVMQLAVKLGGFSMAKANSLRKIIGKKLSPEEFAPYFNAWMENAGEMIGPKAAEEMWRNFEKHAGYSFNRSHAVCYSYIGFVTAWLKHYYPLEYLYSLLKTETKDTTRTTYLLEARRLGIKILGPCVQRSDVSMSVDGEDLRFGLSDVRNVGFGAANEIIARRSFNNWEDFNERITVRKCNSRVVESLVAVDAFRNVTGAPRHPEPQENYQTHLNYPIALESAAKLGLDYTDLCDYDEQSGDMYLIRAVVKDIKRTPSYVRIELEDLTSTITCFGSMDNDLSSGEVVVALVGDRTMVGYARAEGLVERVERGNTDSFEDYIFGDAFENYQLLRMCGFGGLDSDRIMVVPLQVREVTTKNGRQMCFAYVGDGERTIKLTIFPQQWSYAKTKLFEWKPVCVRLGFTSDGSYTLAEGDCIRSADEILQAYKKKMEQT